MGVSQFVSLSLVALLIGATATSSSAQPISQEQKVRQAKALMVEVERQLSDTSAKKDLLPLVKEAQLGIFSDQPNELIDCKPFPEITDCSMRILFFWKSDFNCSSDRVEKMRALAPEDVSSLTIPTETEGSSEQGWILSVNMGDGSDVPQALRLRALALIPNLELIRLRTGKQGSPLNPEAVAQWFQTTVDEREQVLHREIGKPFDHSLQMVERTLEQASVAAGKPLEDIMPVALPALDERLFAWLGNKPSEQDQQFLVGELVMMAARHVINDEHKPQPEARLWKVYNDLLNDDSLQAG